MSNENKPARIWKDYREAENSGQWGWPSLPFQITTVHGTVIDVRKNDPSGILQGLDAEGRTVSVTYEGVDINSINTPGPYLPPDSLKEGEVPEEIMKWAEGEAEKHYQASTYQKPLGKTMWHQASRQMAIAMYRFLEPDIALMQSAIETLRKEATALREGSQQWQSDYNIAREQRDADMAERDKYKNALKEIASGTILPMLIAQHALK